MNRLLEYDKIYSSGNPYFPSDPLPQLLRILTRLTPPASCLDLGCGEGRDALLIASHGHNVTAVDSSFPASSFLTSEARKRNFKITAFCKDIRELDFPNSTYDLIYARTLLDHIPFTDTSAIAKRICLSLKAGGLLLVEVFSVNDPGNKPHHCLPQSELASLVHHYFTEKELFELFKQLQFISLDRCFKYDATHGKPHFHETLILNAEKSHFGWKIRKVKGYE